MQDHGPRCRDVNGETESVLSRQLVTKAGEMICICCVCPASAQCSGVRLPNGGVTGVVTSLLFTAQPNCATLTVIIMWGGCG